MRTHNGYEAPFRIATVVALAATLLGGARNVVAGDAVTIETAQPAGGGAGMRVYRDPVTGEFTAPPPGTALPPAAHSFGTATPQLIESPGTSPAGGMTIDLQGAFQSSITATADGGSVRTGCHSDAPGATPK